MEESDQSFEPPQAEDQLTVMQAAEQKVSRMIGNIDPAVKKHPDLYHRVVKRIKQEHPLSGRPRGRWGDSSLSQQFNGWVRTAGENDKPSLESLFAMLAAHSVLCKSTTDKFSLEVQKRGLKEWAHEQLKLAKDQAGKKGRPKKKAKKIKVEATETVSAVASIQSLKDIPLPSIERDPDTEIHSSPVLRPSCVVGTIPSPKPLVEKRAEPHTSQHFAVGPAPKRHKEADEPVERRPSKMTDTATQTDNEEPSVSVPDLLSALTGAVSTLQETFTASTEALKMTFQETVSEQTKAMTQVFPTVIRETVQEAVSEEAARQRGDPLLRPQGARLSTYEVARPRPTLGGYEPLTTPARRGPALRTEIEYEDGSVVEQRLVGRRAAAVMQQEPEGVVNLSAYRYFPDGQGRRL